MRKVIIFFLFIFPFSVLQAQEKFELTKVDLFSLGKFPISSQISVMGVAVGDPFDEALKKLGKSPKNVIFNGTVHRVDYGEEDCRYISRDNKLVTSIVIFPSFKHRLVGKTSDYFELMSPDRMKNFLNQYLGSPEYVHVISLMGWTSFIYSSGIIFRNIGSNNNILIEDQIEIDKEIKDPDTKRISVYDKPVEKPRLSSSAGFRNALWGMTKEQVRKAESSEFIKASRVEGDMSGIEMLMYKTDALGMSAVIGYYFAGDALTRARYIISETHSDYNLYIKDFEKIEGQLTEKYGAPSRDQKLWSNELFKDDPSKYGLAIASGHVTYVSEWYPNETTIQLLMRGDNFKVSLWVEYTGDKFAEYEKDVIKRSRKSIW